MLKAALVAAAAACKAYCAYVEHQQWNSVDKIEDEIDKISRGELDASDKLRIQRLLQRKKRHIERVSPVRPTSSDTDQGSDVSV